MRKLLTLLLAALLTLPALAEEAQTTALPPPERVLSVLNDVHALHAHGQALIAASTDETWYASYAAEVAGRLTGRTVPASEHVWQLHCSGYTTGTAYSILYAEEAGIVSACFQATTLFASDAGAGDCLLLYVTQDMPYLVAFSSDGEAAMLQAWVAPVELLAESDDPAALLANLAPCGVTGVTAFDWPESVVPAPREASTGTQMPDMARVEALIARMDEECSQREPEAAGFSSAMWVDENGQLHFTQQEPDKEAWAALFDRGEPRMALCNGPVEDWPKLRALCGDAEGVDWYIEQEANAYAVMAVTSLHVYKDETSYRPPVDLFSDFYVDDSVSPFGFCFLLYEDAFPVVVSWQAENGAVMLTGMYASNTQYEDCQSLSDVYKALVEYTEGQLDFTLRVLP